MLNTVKWHLIGLLMAVLKLIPGHRSEWQGEAAVVSLGRLCVWWDGYYGLPYEARRIMWDRMEIAEAWLAV